MEGEVVVPLLGHPIPLKQGESDERIVQQLEKLLDDARSGKMRALAYCAYWSVDQVSFGWTYGAYAFHLGAAVMALNVAYGKELCP
jgi:hypothetical protein